MTPSHVAHVVWEDGWNVLYFKRVASSLFSDFEAADRGEYLGPWEVVRQTGTARVNLVGPNAHRTTVASFVDEAAADDYLALLPSGRPSAD